MLVYKIGRKCQKTENKDYFAVSEGVDIIYLEGQNEKGKETHAGSTLKMG